MLAEAAATTTERLTKRSAPATEPTERSVPVTEPVTERAVPVTKPPVEPIERAIPTTEPTERDIPAPVEPVERLPEPITEPIERAIPTTEPVTEPTERRHRPTAEPATPVTVRARRPERTVEEASEPIAEPIERRHHPIAEPATPVSEPAVHRHPRWHPGPKIRTSLQSRLVGPGLDIGVGIDAAAGSQEGHAGLVCRPRLVARVGYRLAGVVGPRMHQRVLTDRRTGEFHGHERADHCGEPEHRSEGQAASVPTEARNLAG